MPYNFYPVDREQKYILPPSISDWLPHDSLAWFILDSIGEMDIEKIYKKYRMDGQGATAYNPGMLTALLLYSYCNGERSSRVIEELCKQNISYRVITANQFPDHSTIARFRQENLSELDSLFTDVLTICDSAGIAKVGLVALDGTKFKANASLDANLTKKTINKKVKEMLKEAQETDKREDAEEKLKAGKGDEKSAKAKREDRIKKFKESLAELKKREEEKKAQEERKITERKALEELEKNKGKKVRGRKPKPSEEKKEKELKVNTTDFESRILKTRNGFIQGYNAQIVVNENQVILAAEVTQEENDWNQLHPMIERAKENLTEAGIGEEIKKLTADAGYGSEDNLSGENENTPEFFIAVKKDYKTRKSMHEDICPRGRIPSDLSYREKMSRKLSTKRGKKIYKKRGQIVEPVIGQIKNRQSEEGFMQRGSEKCDSEWKIMCLCHNLLKVWRKKLRDIKNGINGLVGNENLGLMAI